MAPGGSWQAETEAGLEVGWDKENRLPRRAPMFLEVSKWRQIAPSLCLCALIKLCLTYSKGYVINSEFKGILPSNLNIAPSEGYSVQHRKRERGWLRIMGGVTLRKKKKRLRTRISKRETEGHILFFCFFFLFVCFILFLNLKHCISFAKLSNKYSVYFSMNYPFDLCQCSKTLC